MPLLPGHGTAGTAVAGSGYERTRAWNLGVTERMLITRK